MNRAVTVAIAFLCVVGLVDSAFGISANTGYGIDLMFDADDPQTAIFARNLNSTEFWSSTFVQPGIALIPLDGVTYRAFAGAAHFRTYNMGDTITSGYGDAWTITRTLSLGPGAGDDDVLYLGAEPANARTPLVPIYTGNWVAAGSLGIMVGARYRYAAAYTQITSYKPVQIINGSTVTYGDYLASHHPYTAYLQSGDSGKPLFVVSTAGDAYYIASHYTTRSAYSPIPDLLSMHPNATYVGYDGALAKYIDIHPATDVTWSFVTVPEPASLSLCLLGALACRRRRRRRPATGI